MAGRRGARAGRGWDAIPPRPVDPQTDDEDFPGGGPRRDDSERGNVPVRRRRGSPGTIAFGTVIGGSTGGGSSSGGTSGGNRSGGTGGGNRSGGTGGGNRSGDGAGLSGGGRRGARGSAVSGSNGIEPPGRRRRGDGELGSSDYRLDDSDGSGATAPRDESELAREICLRQLAVRPRTRVELAKALARKEISDEVITEVLDRYDEVGIIDDAAFARAWVSTRHHGRGLARRALANELRQRGVDAEVASEALETLDEDDEVATARALIDRKLRTATGAPEAIFRRLVGTLARKGYPAGVAFRVVKEALAARDAEAAEFAEQIDPDALSEE